MTKLLFKVKKVNTLDSFKHYTVLNTKHNQLQNNITLVSSPREKKF